MAIECVDCGKILDEEEEEYYLERRADLEYYRKLRGQRAIEVALGKDPILSPRCKRCLGFYLHELEVEEVMRKRGHHYGGVFATGGALKRKEEIERKKFPWKRNP
jgi:phage FluMu protein Com